MYLVLSAGLEFLLCNGMWAGRYESSKLNHQRRTATTLSSHLYSVFSDWAPYICHCHQPSTPASFFGKFGTIGVDLFF